MPCTVPIPPAFLWRGRASLLRRVLKSWYEKRSCHCRSTMSNPPSTGCSTSWKGWVWCMSDA
ncbi:MULTISPECIES: DUF6504 family protein [Enterobacteriaceae]|uniref:DUF6504 family protein n=1 Tax=Enterobacteriaceae TaxID=543 RepID=UPI001D0DA2E5